MPRPAFIFTVALTTLASSCATNPENPRCHTDIWGGCQQADPVVAAIELGALAIVAGTYVAVSQSRRSSRRRSAPPGPLVGQVRWRGSSEKLPPELVTLRGTDSAVVRKTTADQAGWFQFPFPRKPGWYTVSVHADLVEGETTLWLQDRHPDAVEVLLRRKVATPVLDGGLPADRAAVREK